MIAITLAATAALGWLAAPPAEDPEASAEVAFASEAAADYGELTFVACYVDPSGAPIGCYGMTSTPSLLVGIAQPGEPFTMTEYSTIVSGETPTTAGGEPAPTAAPTFGEGTFVVGTDVQPGTYRATVPEDSFNCYWERLSGFGGDILADIIANDNSNPGAQVIVEIAPSDAGFSSSGCGEWTPLE